MRLGVVYLPPPPVLDACVRYAAALVRGRTARIVVGEGRVPHLSLVHVETKEDPAVIFGALAGVAPTCAIAPLALGILRYDRPYNAPPAVPASMAWLIAPASAALRSAEEAACAAVGPHGSITTANGDAFQPHVTLAIWEGPPGEVDVLHETLRSPFEGRLALGLIEANGVYAKTLFSVPSVA